MRSTAFTDQLLEPELHAAGVTHDVWRWMRAQAPVCWHSPTDFPGFWSVTRYEDVRDVYRDPMTFSSTQGVLLRPSRYGNDPASGMTLALTDPPRHRQVRMLVSDWFTERSARSLTDSIRSTVRRILAGLDEEECDFAHDVAAAVTLSVICRILGVPDADHDAVLGWTTAAFEAAKPLATQQQLMQYFVDMMDERLDEPTDDLMSRLVHGTIDGQELTDAEVLLNCENLLGATENAGLSMAAGMMAFLEHPDQWKRLQDDRSLLSSAVEEVLRWTSSATHSMRTVTADHAEVRGQRMEPGDRVVLWLPSANRDDEAFADAQRFDITRRPNRHLALGSGEHMCIGSALARSEMRVLFSELLEGTVELCGPVIPLSSVVINGPAHMPIRMRMAQR